MNWFSSAGLILDIIGILFLFEYGLPSKIKEHGGSILMEENNEDEMDRDAKNNKIRRRSYFGLSLILIGSILQLIGTNINVSTCFLLVFLYP